ncbi:MAG: hypothetical protein K1060chlam5_00291 [Candidatus Anoxychlamydiales bacterium]|nr:hypothetical protein [Candidatus Anoxychlamydiales bacterium]
MKKNINKTKLELTFNNNIYRKKINIVKGVSMTEKKLRNNFLIITSSGGGGLLQAAEAQQQIIKKEKPNAKVIKVDLLLEWIGGLFGHFGVNSWNNAQRTGKVAMQHFLGNRFSQRLAEFIFWPKIFLKTFLILKKEDIDVIIDTQPLGCSAIIKAIRIYNKISNKNVSLQRIIVDLPTTKAIHFFKNVKRLSKTDKKYINISTVEPLLNKNESDIDFWKKHCGIDLNKVCYLSYPIRCEFQNYIHKEVVLDSFKIHLKTKSSQEKEVIKKIIQKGSLNIIEFENQLEFLIEKNDYLITLLLGSQPSFEGTKNYIKNLVEIVQEKNFNKKIHLFAFCADYNDGLMNKIYKHLNKVKDYPKNISIILMSFQKEDVIARLFYRSDMTITRSGGQTAIELMTVSNAKKFVHSEYKSKHENYSLKNLLKGIPVWEAGNAMYMMEKMGAELITPTLFKTEITKINQ